MLKYFLGNSPRWYKLTMIFFLVINVILWFFLKPDPSDPSDHGNLGVLAWFMIGQFIFTLAMALKCYPLLSGGLLAIQALCLQLTTAKHAYEEVANNLEVILLLVFMVAGIYFMKPLLMFIFSSK